MQFEVERAQSGSSTVAEGQEMLIFYGTTAERAMLESECPEIHEMYIFNHEISDSGPRAQVGNLVGEGWEGEKGIFYKFC